MNGVPIAVPWYKSAVLRGLLMILVTQLIAKAHQRFGIDVSAFGIDANSAVDWLLQLISLGAGAYAFHARIAKPMPPVTLTKAAAVAVNRQTIFPYIAGKPGKSYGDREMTSPLKTLLSLLEADTIKDLGPVAIGAIQTAQKAPGLLGIANAKLYIIGNAPSALLQEESDFLGQAAASLGADLTVLEAQANAAVAAATAANAALAK